MSSPDDDTDTESAHSATLIDLFTQALPESRTLVATLTCIAGRAAGRVYRLDAEEIVLGRSADLGVTIEDEGTSRRHAAITRVGGAHSVRDLGSRNGTFHNGARIEAPVPLRDGDRIRIHGTVFKFGYLDELEEQMRTQLYDLATRDALTQTYNRRYFEERLAAEWAFAGRHRSPCALIAIDADHFKHINDTHGHPAGDLVLRDLAQVIHQVVRKEEMVARIGGEEFVVLARATSRLEATVLAERIRAAVESRPFVFEGTRLAVTISCGIATTDDAGVAAPSELVGRADDALYRAKENGRNRVESVPRQRSAPP